MILNDDELNELKYELAIKKDRRSYCKYYISLLKTNHNFIFAFFYNEDYNSRIIKITLFLIGFTIDYTINILFYTDDTMHNIYENKGKLNLEYEIPKLIYSSLISMILDNLLKMLALSNGGILEFKQNKSIENIHERKNSLIKKLTVKFILYFTISSLLLIFFWYYISIFCVIYRNTQYHLLKDTLMSFILSLLYPFGIYLLPGIFRIPALSGLNIKGEYLYKFSQILQML